MTHLRSLSALTLCLVLVLANSCGKPKPKEGPKPSNDQVSRYLSDDLPPYLTIHSIETSDDAVEEMGRAKAKPGSWRITVRFVVRTAQDLYAPTAQSKAFYTDFRKAVVASEKLRLQRIQAVEAFAAKLGLMKDRASGPAPALAASLVRHSGDDVADGVTLLAEPDGAGWRFVQLDAQSMDVGTLGAPYAALQRDNPKLSIVLEGSPEDVDFRKREAAFLDGLKKLPE